MKSLLGKRIFIFSQVFIILAFFLGMVINYVTLSPIVDKGETYRIASDIDVFFDHFQPPMCRNVYDKARRDSILAHVKPPYECDFILMDSLANIIYSPDGQIGDARELISRKYGTMAVSVLNLELSEPAERSRMVYDADAMFSYYASYETSLNLVCFAAVDYMISGSESLEIFYLLLRIMTIGGVLVILICVFTSRRIIRQYHKDSLVNQELETASEIQRSMLPKGEKHLIQLDIDAKLIPAKKVGGDFYSYYLNNGILYFCIGDVSGKGIPASLFMSKSVTLFRSFASSLQSPSQIAFNMNNELCINNEQDIFVTAIIGTVRVFDGLVHYTNAGHELPVVWDGTEASKPYFLKSQGCIPLGVIPGTEYVEESYEMPKSSMLLFYTDGISEAKSATKGYIAKSSLLDIVDALKKMTSKQINSSLIEHILNYEKGTVQHDDITLLTFKAASSPKHLVIKNSIPELRKLSEFTFLIFKECCLNQKECIRVRAGLDEALTNCVLYAYDEQDRDIEVTALIRDHCLIFEIRDKGKAFNPLEYVGPERKEEDGLQVGGLGISIFKSNFDDVQYSRENDTNILKLIKKL